MSLLKSICTLICVLSLSSVLADDDVGIKVPDGFRVELFADDDLAHDIHSLTFNSLGQLVVSGPGYVRTLLDTDEDGVADKVRVFADAPKTGAQGMFFLGRHLLCSGDEGLQMFRDDNRDGKADGEPEIFLRIAAGREHDVHAIRKGPDGWWYVIAGNMSGVTGAYATIETSPVKQPQSGTLLRLKPDLSGGEILADGFRNAYDFDFNAAGDIFTFDSDGERDITLPWYRPTRVFQVTPRSHAGWISRGWKRPDYFPDMPPSRGKFWPGIAVRSRLLPAHTVSRRIPRSHLRTRLDLRTHLGSAAETRRSGVVVDACRIRVGHGAARVRPHGRRSQSGWKSVCEHWRPRNPGRSLSYFSRSLRRRIGGHRNGSQRFAEGPAGGAAGIQLVTSQVDSAGENTRGKCVHCCFAQRRSDVCRSCARGRSADGTF